MSTTGSPASSWGDRSTIGSGFGLQPQRSLAKPSWPSTHERAVFPLALGGLSAFAMTKERALESLESTLHVTPNRGQVSHFERSAKLTASSRAVSLKGLNRHSTAPSSSSRGRAVLSVLAVMKMMGISCLRSFNSH